MISLSGGYSDQVVRVLDSRLGGDWGLDPGVAEQWLSSGSAVVLKTLLWIHIEGDSFLKPLQKNNQ